MTESFEQLHAQSASQSTAEKARWRHTLAKVLAGYRAMAQTLLSNIDMSVDQITAAVNAGTWTSQPESVASSTDLYAQGAEAASKLLGKTECTPTLAQFTVQSFVLDEDLYARDEATARHLKAFLLR
jgi:hypothetical protein